MLLKIKRALESKYVVPCVFFVAFVLWLLGDVTEGNGYNIATLCFLVLIVILVLCFCDDVKNIFCPVLYAGLCIKTITLNSTTRSTWAFYITCVVVAVVAFITFTVIKIVKNRNTIKLGKMFYPLVVLDVVFLLGGIFCNFQAEEFFVTFGLSIAILLLYFLAVNFTRNLGDFFIKLFIFGALFASMQMLVNNFIESGFSIGCIFHMANPWVTAEGPNTTAIFFGIGAVCSLFLTDKSKHGYLYFLPTVFFAFMIVMTVCRGMIITIFLILPVEFVLLFRKTHDKKSYLYVVLCIITVLAFFELTFQIISDPFNIVYDKFINSGTSGRTDGLYEWCINKFLEHPILGYGFLAKVGEIVPAIRNGSRYILAHNTIIQYLVSVGIVGSIVAIYFYTEKYRLYFTDFYGTPYLIFSALVIALSGMVDQAAMTDPFIFTTAILLLSAKEKDLESKGIAFIPLIKLKTFNKKQKGTTESNE